MRDTHRTIRLAAGLLGIILAMAGAAVPVLAQTQAQAQDQRGLSIVVIDTQRIYREAEAVKELQRKIDDQRSSYQNELREKEEVLRDADQELARQRTILSAEAFAQKRRELEQRVAKLQGEVQSRRKDLEKEFALGMRQVQAELVQIAREIADEHKADLVIEKSAVVLVRPELEITQEALKRLNTRLPKIAPPAPQD